LNDELAQKSQLVENMTGERYYYYYRQDLPEEQLCRYCFYSRADFWVLRPAGATRCTDQGEICKVIM